MSRPARFTSAVSSRVTTSSCSPTIASSERCASADPSAWATGCSRRFVTCGGTFRLARGSPSSTATTSACACAWLEPTPTRACTCSPAASSRRCWLRRRSIVGAPAKEARAWSCEAAATTSRAETSATSTATSSTGVRPIASPATCSSAPACCSTPGPCAAPRRADSKPRVARATTPWKRTPTATYPIQRPSPKLARRRWRPRTTSTFSPAPASWRSTSSPTPRVS